MIKSILFFQNDYLIVLMNKVILCSLKCLILLTLLAALRLGSSIAAKTFVTMTNKRVSESYDICSMKNDFFLLIYSDLPIFNMVGSSYHFQMPC